MVGMTIRSEEEGYFGCSVIEMICSDLRRTKLW